VSVYWYKSLSVPVSLSGTDEVTINVEGVDLEISVECELSEDDYEVEIEIDEDEVVEHICDESASDILSLMSRVLDDMDMDTIDSGLLDLAVCRLEQSGLGPQSIELLKSMGERIKALQDTADGESEEETPEKEAAENPLSGIESDNWN
jgi:hypothetical protein